LQNHVFYVEYGYSLSYMALMCLHIPRRQSRLATKEPINAVFATSSLKWSRSATWIIPIYGIVCFLVIYGIVCF
jgi:hypothetical protein